MDEIRYRLVQAGRSMLETPFHHQGRVAHVGVDCVGLLVLTGRMCGFQVQDTLTYQRLPWDDGKTLIEWMDKNCDKTDQMVPGNMVVFWIEKPGIPQHVGLLTPYGFVHTYTEVGKVVEHRMTKAWSDRVHSIYTFRVI